MHELAVVHATADDKADFFSLVDPGEGLEGTGGAGFRGLLVGAEDRAVIVARGRFELGQFPANDEVVLLIRCGERGSGGVCEVVAFAPLEGDHPGSAGDVALVIEFGGAGQAGLQKGGRVGDLSAHRTLTEENSGLE